LAVAVEADRGLEVPIEFAPCPCHPCRGRMVLPCLDKKKSFT